MRGVDNDEYQQERELAGEEPRVERRCQRKNQDGGDDVEDEEKDCDEGILSNYG